MAASPLRQRAARSLFWTLVESGGLSGVSLVTLVVLAHFLSPAQMGLGTVALGIVQVLIVPVEILFQDALIQRRDVEDAHFDTAFTATLALGVATLAAAWACSGLLARFLDLPVIVPGPAPGPGPAFGTVPGTASGVLPGFAPVFTLMALSLLPMAFGTVVAARQRRELEFRSLALRSLAGRLGGAGAAVLVAACGGGVWALVVQQVLLVTLAAAVLWLMAARRPRLRFSARHFHDLIGFGLRSVAVMSAQVAIPRVFTLLAGSLLGAAAVGYLTIAFRAVDMLRDVVAGAVVQLALPVFNRARTAPGGLQAGYTEAVGLTCLAGFPLFVGLALCAPELVQLLFGPRWEPSVPFVALLGVLVVPYLMRLYILPCLAAAGRPLAALPGLLATLAFVVAGMELAGRLSLAAAAAVWAARLLVGIPVDALVLRRVGGIGLRVQLSGTAMPLLGSTAMAGVVLAARVLLLGNLPALPRLAAMVVLGTVVYAGLLLLGDRAAVRRLLAFARAAVAQPGASQPGTPQPGTSSPPPRTALELSR